MKILNNSIIEFDLFDFSSETINLYNQKKKNDEKEKSLSEFYIFNYCIETKDKKFLFQKHCYNNPHLFENLRKKYNENDFKNEILSVISKEDYLEENIEQYDDYEYIKNILYPLQLKVLHKIFDSKYGTIKLNTGFGKTVIASSVIFLNKKPALFIVDNKVLMNQFKDTVKRFFNAKVNELNNNKFTVKKLNELKEKDYFENDEIFWVTTVQMLYRKIKDKPLEKILHFNDLYSVFKLVFYDEAHTTGGAALFAKTSILFRTLNTFGLTATPYNSGLNKILYESTFGNNLITVEEENEKLTECLSEIRQTFFSTNMYYPGLGGRDEHFAKKYGLYQINLSKDKNFYRIILYRIKEILSENSNRNILILVKTVNAGKKLKELLEYEFNKQIDFIYSNNKTIYHDTNIIISTIDFGKKGLDIPKIDYIINTSPFRSKNSLYQIIGRALRLYRNKETGEICEKPPIVYEEIIPLKYYSDYKIAEHYYEHYIVPKYGNVKLQIKKYILNK